MVLLQCATHAENVGFWLCTGFGILCILFVYFLFRD